MKRVGPARSKSGFRNVEILRQPRSGPPGSSKSGSGRASIPGERPVASSVMQTNRCGRFRWRPTMDASLFTYSGPYFEPHFMQITFAIVRRM